LFVPDKTFVLTICPGNTPCIVDQQVGYCLNELVKVFELAHVDAISHVLGYLRQLLHEDSRLVKHIQRARKDVFLLYNVLVPVFSLRIKTEKLLLSIDWETLVAGPFACV